MRKSVGVALTGLLYLGCIPLAAPAWQAPLDRLSTSLSPNPSAEIFLYDDDVEDKLFETRALDPILYFKYLNISQQSEAAFMGTQGMAQDCLTNRGEALDVGEIAFALERIRKAIAEGTQDIQQILGEITQVLGPESMKKMSLVSGEGEEQVMQLTEMESNAQKMLDRMKECGARVNEKTMGMRYDGICNHHGRVWGLGMFKTGTTTLTAATDKLGYKMATPTQGFAGGYINPITDFFDDELINKDIDNWKPGYYSQPVSDYLDIAWTAADGPWLFLFKRMDRWYPNSKFILTLRDNTYQVVNSDAKMATRGNQGYSMLDITKMQQKKHYHMIYGHSLIDFALLTARRYELHNQLVREHFAGRKDDLLEIDFMTEREQPWAKISEFLGGCTIPEGFDFPHNNVAPSTQPDYDIEELMKPGGAMDWRLFDFTAIDGGFKIVPKSGEGTHKIGDWTYVCTYCEGFMI